MTSQNNPPDLNSILRTLSAFSNQANTHSQPPSNHETNENDHDYEPPDARPPVTQSHIQPQPRSYSQSQPQQQPQLHYQPGQAPPPISLSRQPRKESPSSTITTWPAALKQVMRTVGQNEEIQRRIRFLIQRQHHHEKQWWKGREVLLQKQKSRKEKKKELDEVLRSVGAPVDEKEVSTAEEDVAEIQNYDGKVYKASKQMADAMLNELKVLDVPFFSIKQGLVVTDGPEKKKQEQNPPLDQGHGPGTLNVQGRLSLDELAVLQRRMLELLQDLCRE